MARESDHDSGQRTPRPGPLWAIGRGSGGLLCHCNPEPRDPERRDADRLDLPGPLPAARSAGPARRSARVTGTSAAPPTRTTCAGRGLGRRAPTPPRPRQRSPGSRPRRAHARRGPSGVAIEATPLAAVPLRVRPGVPDRQCRTGRHGRRHEHRERRRQRPGRPVPGVDGQQRDPDRERQPRPGRALEPEVVGEADAAARPSRSRRSPTPTGPTARRRRRLRPRPRRAASAARRGRSGSASRASRSASAGASCEVVHGPDRDLERGHRDRRAGRRRRPRRRQRARAPNVARPSSSDGNGWVEPDEPGRVGPPSDGRGVMAPPRARQT